MQHHSVQDTDTNDVDDIDSFTTHSDKVIYIYTNFMYVAPHHQTEFQSFSDVTTNNDIDSFTTTTDKVVYMSIINFMYFHLQSTPPGGVSIISEYQ